MILVRIVISVFARMIYSGFSYDFLKYRIQILAMFFRHIGNLLKKIKEDG